MIRATDAVMFEAECNHCHRPDWLILPAGSTFADAHAQLVSDGWTDEHWCLTCQADDGVPLPVIVSDYLPCETLPEPTDRSVW